MDNFNKHLQEQCITHIKINIQYLENNTSKGDKTIKATWRTWESKPEKDEGVFYAQYLLQKRTGRFKRVLLTEEQADRKIRKKKNCPGAEIIRTIIRLNRQLKELRRAKRLYANKLQRAQKNIIETIQGEDIREADREVTNR